jgi:quercetin dioxygenase-like cupin family protein
MLRKIALIALVVAAFSLGWLTKSAAQQSAASPIITYFSHEKVDASFAKALATNSPGNLFSRKDKRGTTYSVKTNSRGKADNGEIHSHKEWTAVVMVVSGAATVRTPGTPDKGMKAGTTNEFGGVLVGRGESHRVSKGDVLIVPPDAPHSYHDIEEPFRYMVIETP